MISSCVPAFAKEDIEVIMSHVSFNYADDYGGSYLVIRKRAEALFRAYEDMEVISEIYGITVKKDSAIADMRVSLIASSGDERGYLFGDAGSHREMQIFFEKGEFGWKITGMKLINHAEPVRKHTE